MASKSTTPVDPAPTDLIDRLTGLLGQAGISTQADDLLFYSQDLFFEGVVPLAIVRPANTAQVVDLVRFCRENRIALHARGGGMSYTEAFQPQTATSLLLDTTRLDAILEVALDGAFVTAGSGCNWARLDAELAKKGLRARFWGPMSGGTATLGGSISQGSVTFGSGLTGASANAVKSMEIVTGTGEIIHTGSDGCHATTPFNRNYGPDLTGIFANDAGALGVKTAITLETEPRPAIVSGLSFAFDDFDAMARMFHEVTVRRLASEMIGMDAAVARQNAGKPDLVSDIKAMIKIGATAGNPLTGLGRMARVATGGRRFLDRAHYTAHFVIEARDAGDLKSRIKAVRGFAAKGDEIVNTVPLMTRAQPFPALPVTHPDGRRMLPIHGVFPTSALGAFHRDYLALKERFAPRMAGCEVTIAEFFASIAGIGLLYEPVFYWPDCRMVYHDRLTPDYLEGQLADYPANEEARELVREMTEAIVTLMREHGSGHFQIGRLYPCASEREAGSGELLRALKRHLDPDNIINPGALGL